MSQYLWQPIADFEIPPIELSIGELRSLLQVWNEQRDKLETSKATADFQDRLVRQWAIETGIIEGLYTIDRGTTQLLIERGLTVTLMQHGSTDKSPEVVMSFLRNHHEVIEGLFDFVSSNRDLSVSYIKQIHQALTRSQDTVEVRDQFGRTFHTQLTKGDWKAHANNPMREDGSIHEYCPPEHVAAEMDRLIELHQQHVCAGVDAQVEAAWLHHRFTQIHPFQDGNGRVARALATLVSIKAGYFPVVITRDDRAAYISALERADSGDLSLLVQLFAKLQKSAFIEALGLSREVLTATHQAQVLGAIEETLKTRQEQLNDDMSRVFQFADGLHEQAATHMQSLLQQLEDRIAAVHKEYQFHVASAGSGADRSHYYKFQIVEAAKKLHYFAETKRHRSWVGLFFRGESLMDIIISFHGLGVEFRGVMVASALAYERSAEDQEGVDPARVHVLCDQPFQFNYLETSAVLRARFGDWLDAACTCGLDAWRRSL